MFCILLPSKNESMTQIWKVNIRFVLMVSRVTVNSLEQKYSEHV